MRIIRQIDITKYHGDFDVIYSKESTTCKMDIFLPEGKGPFPIIISIHGGAFKKMDKRDEEMILDMLYGLKKGYAVVGVNYRLSGEATFPKPVQDINQAIRFIKLHADKYHLNKEKIVVWGGSAGGYFSLMSGLIDQVALFNQENNPISSKVQGVVAWFPPVDFSKMDQQLKQLDLLKTYPDHDADDSPESLFVGYSVGKHPDKVQEANPECYIHKDMCPIFIQHGSNDQVVPYLGSKHFADMVNQRYPNRVIYEIINDAGHGDKKFSTKENLERVYRFINKIFNS